MTYEEIVATLAYAGDHEQPVRVRTAERQELVGVPTALDTHVTAHEVYLRLAGAEDTEVAVSLAAIAAVELL